MKKIQLTPNMLTNGLRGMFIVAATTVPMWLIGRDVLGEAKGRPDRLRPILNAWGFVGEIQVWRGE